MKTKLHKLASEVALLVVVNQQLVILLVNTTIKLMVKQRDRTPSRFYRGWNGL